MKDIILITADGEPYAATSDMYTAEKVVEHGKKEKDWELDGAEDISFTKVTYYYSEDELRPLTLGLKKGTICKFDLEDITPDEFGDLGIEEYDGQYCVIDSLACPSYYNIEFCTVEPKSVDAVSDYHLTEATDFNYTELNQLLRLAKYYIKMRLNAKPHGEGICTYWNIIRERDCYFRIKATGQLLLVFKCSQYSIDDLKSAMKNYLNYNHDKVEAIANGETE